MKNKTIFTIMTLGLVTLLGFGFLGGINYQPKVAKASEITTQPNKKYAKVSPSVDEPLKKDKTYYFVAKRYAQNGQGAFYENSISLENSLVASSDFRIAEAEFTLISNDSYIRNRIYFSTSQSVGAYHLNVVGLYNVSDSGSSGHYATIYQADSGVFNRTYCAFLCTDFLVNTNHANGVYWYFEHLFDIYEMQSNFYEFADTINYNATYGQDLDSFVVNDSFFSDNSHLFKEITLYTGVPFYSGGLVFDTITLSFDNAYATKFRTNENNIQAWSSFNFGYFHEMRFKNSATNLIVSVNTRIFEAYYNASESGLYLTRNSKWVSKDYQKIIFFDDMNDITLTNLSKLNNTSFSGGYYDGYSTNTNIGLGNAFSLISQAFTAWLPILQVTIVPGITLGLLLFLPLIAGIIIFIIWIVKR